jgi:cell division protein ZapA
VKKMPEVNIIINNREHKIACSAGEEERVKELANLLNNEVVSIADSLGQIGDVKLMVLAAITILDKNQDAIEDAIKIINNSTKKIEKIYNKIENNT